MRNLTVVDVVHHNEAIPTLSQIAPCITIDSDNECAYCTTDNGVVALDMRSGDVVREVDLRSAGLLPEIDTIVDIHFRLDDMSLCIALSNGDLLSWSPGSNVECVGCIGEGISAMGWSPDGELLVIFTLESDGEPARIYLLVCHGSELEPLTDVPFSTADFGEAEFVTVGWGKKETQFHGSEGKQAATKKENVQSGVRSVDDKRARIRWIGDGRFFAVSAVDRTAGARKIRVWTREGVLHSTSEILTGLEQALDWRPSGNLIASSQTHKNKHQIVFFERNGLRHGDFTLPYSIDTVKVREVLWNNESNVLCVWLEDLMSSKSFVQLWTMNNYHWYLKQSLEFSDQGQRPCSVLWDVIDSTALYVLSVNGSLTKYNIDWVTNANTHSGSQHEVAVIDGDKLLMTPFRTMVVPPPMCAYSLQFSSHIRNVSFCQTDNQMAVLLNSGEVVIYRLGDDVGSTQEKLDQVHVEAAGGAGFAVKSSLPGQSSTYRLPEILNGQSHSFRHLSWLSNDQLCIVRNDVDGNILTVLSYKQENPIMHVCCQSVVGRVRTLCSAAGNRLILQYNDGSVWNFHNNECTAYGISGGSTLTFPVPCQTIDLCTFAGQEAVVGLSQRYRLFVNSHEIATNCTSFSLHDDFMLLTSHNHTTRCISRCTPLNELVGLADGKKHIFDEMVRRVERGSRIVICVSDDTKVILQMPRGNLECIHPRALVLSTVRKLLDRLKYKQAFSLMHRHRLNMNLICDHNRKTFLENVRLFVDELDSVAHLNQFITDLREEDVTYTMYTGFYVHESSVLTQTNKVDTVCDSIITTLRGLDSDKYLLSILTAHVRKTAPELETALTIIKSLQDTNKAGAEDALKYLMFLVDVNELFDVALGMYDFGLVLMVAEKSQKDPKEYLMFLNEIRQMETNYQKYTIDKHLKRYSSALLHISKCGRFSEMLALVKDQKLYMEALELLPIGSQEREEVLLAFADYLKEKKRHEEAGLLFAQADQHRMAVECFIECGSWQQGIISIEKSSFVSTARIQYIKELAEKLKTKRMHEQASTLLEVYAEQPEEAITTLIEGCLWEESLRLIHKYDRHDFVETDWKPALEEHRQQTLSHMQSDVTDLVAYKDRFMTVLQANRSKADLIGEEFRDVDADMYSDTSSMTGVSAVSSSHSRSTGRTSKNQRKAQRKKWSLKEGSKFEDLALLDEMKKLVGRIDSIRDDVRALLLALVKVNQLKKASELQELFSSALSTTVSLVPEVWSVELVQSSAQLTGEHSTVNSILESMAKLNVGTAANPSASQAEIEVKRSPVISTDSTWKLTMLSKMV